MRQRAPVNPCSATRMQISARSRNSPCSVWKGMAAYYEHAAHPGEENSEIISFICRALATISNPDADMNTLLGVVLETGKYGVDVMALLDKANTQAYGNPELTRVNIGTGSNPGILISGHDLEGYRRSPHPDRRHGHRRLYPWRDASCPLLSAAQEVQASVGNYGNAWWKQKEEFESFNGPVVFTTNCIVPPSPSAGYRNRVFTTNSTGFPGWKHIQGGCRRPQGLLRGDCACQDLPAT